MSPRRRVKQPRTKRLQRPNSTVRLERAVAVQREESRRHAEHWLGLRSALEESLGRYHALFEDAPVAYLVLDPSGIIFDVNAAGTVLLGFARDRVVGKPILLYVHAKSRKALLAHLHKCAGEQSATELLLRTDSDTPRPVLMTSKRGWLPGPGGGFALHTIMTDISDRRGSEDALRSSEKQHREIVETANEGICIVDERNHIVFANRRLGNMLGTTAEDLVGRSAFDLVPDDDRAEAERRFTARDSSALGQSEQRLRRMDGTILWTSASTTVMRDKEGRFTGLLLMYTDATARHELTASREKAVRAVISAQEQERQRIARELHDQMGQHIVALSLGLARLASVTQQVPEALPLIEQLQRAADWLGRDVHTLALELRPSALDHLGLAVALSNYAEDVAARSGLDIDVHCDTLDGQHISAAVQTGMYRIAQEALTNVVKHAAAKRVSVILECRGGALQLIVEDDGAGFNQFSRETTKLGLAGMQERASLLRGMLTVESSPGRGTTVYARIPLSETDVQDDEQTTSTVTR